MRIFGMPGDNAGCRHFRMQLPLKALAARGHKAVILTNEVSREYADNCDVIVGQRVCHPQATAWWRKWAKAGRAKLVFEVDDDLFRVDPSNRQAYRFFSDNIIRTNLAENMQRADLVTVTSDKLAEQMSRFNRNVAVLPNCISGGLLDHQVERRDDVLTIGWGGSPTHEVDWQQADKRVAQFVNRTPGTEIHIIGGWMPPGLESVPEQRRRLTGWFKTVDALHRGMDFHIGVVPLRDIPFNHGKSDLKFLELAALGVPAVASDVGPYALSVQHEVTGLLVREQGDWTRHLRALTADEGLRESIGKAAKDWAATRTIEGNAHLWAEAYAENTEDRMTA